MTKQANIGGFYKHLLNDLARVPGTMDLKVEPPDDDDEEDKQKEKEKEPSKPKEKKKDKVRFPFCKDDSLQKERPFSRKRRPVTAAGERRRTLMRRKTTPTTDTTTTVAIVGTRTGGTRTSPRSPVTRRSSSSSSSSSSSRSQSIRTTRMRRAWRCAAWSRRRAGASPLWASPRSATRRGWKEPGASSRPPRRRATGPSPKRTGGDWNLEWQSLECDTDCLWRREPSGKEEKGKEEASKLFIKQEEDEEPKYDPKKVPFPPFFIRKQASLLRGFGR